MTIEQAERFYEQDNKNYEIKKNKVFLNWLENIIDDGYNCFIKIEELQELINNIVNWYEIKYPERELENLEGIRNEKFKDIKRISNVMDIKQLLFRLPHNQLCLIECGYRANGGIQYQIYENGQVKWKSQIIIRTNKKNEKNNFFVNKIPYFLIYADYMTGEISKNYELGEYLNSEKNITLDELLSIFNKKYVDVLDFTELKQSVYNHNCDIELRRRILQLTALKLLYSKNTIPERGYERAKRFINEFNKKLCLNLSTEEIDEIIYRNYNNKDKCAYFFKPYDYEQEEKCLYYSVENVCEGKRDKIKGIKRLLKIMYNKNRK